MAKITKDDLEHVAILARLDLTKEEKAKFTDQLGSILEYFEKLDLAQIKGVEAIHQINNMANVIREDKIGPKYDQKELLENTPEQENGFIKVKAVFE